MFSVFATLGDALISPRLSPTALEARQGAVFAEHAIFSGAPRLQYTGRQLDTLSLTFDLHFSFCTPVQERAKLQAMLREHQAHALVFGDGSFWGWFVLESLNTTVEQCSPDGTPWCITMQSELREFTGDPAAPLQCPAVSDSVPFMAVYPGASSLLSLPVPSAGGGVWDAVRDAVSCARQAGSVISQAADMVDLAGRMAQSGQPWETVSLALGGAVQLTGMLASARDLSVGFGNALSTCARALPLAGVDAALDAGRELTSLIASGVHLADSLGADVSAVSQTLDRIDTCLDAGAACLDSCSPVLQRFSAHVAAREDPAS